MRTVRKNDTRSRGGEGGLTGHFGIGDGIGQDLGQVQKDATALIQDLDAGFDLEVLADGGVKRVEGGFAVPEEVGHVEHIRGYSARAAGHRSAAEIGYGKRQGMEGKGMAHRD